MVVWDNECYNGRKCYLNVCVYDIPGCDVISQRSRLRLTATISGEMVWAADPSLPVRCQVDTTHSRGNHSIQSRGRPFSVMVESGTRKSQHFVIPFNEHLHSGPIEMWQFPVWFLKWPEGWHDELDMVGRGGMICYCDVTTNKVFRHCPTCPARSPQSSLR